MFEVLEHTADTGFQARAASLGELFAACAEALISITVEAGAAAAETPYPLAASGEDLDSLMVNWLSEVLYYLDAERVLFRRIEIRELTAGEIKALAWGEARDDARHPPKLIVKGITYHQLVVKPDPEAGGWIARVFVDV